MFSLIIPLNAFSTHAFQRQPSLDPHLPAPTVPWRTRDPLALPQLLGECRNSSRHRPRLWAFGRPAAFVHGHWESSRTDHLPLLVRLVHPAHVVKFVEFVF